MKLDLYHFWDGRLMAYWFEAGPSKLFRLKIQDGQSGNHLENLFFAFSPESKGQLN